MKYLLQLSIFIIILSSCAQQNYKVVSQQSYVDSDLDGVHDQRDACPFEAGSIFNLGCPKSSNHLSSQFNKEDSTDSDLDSVPDDKDECPEVYGSPFNMGCPFKEN